MTRVYLPPKRTPALVEYYRRGEGIREMLLSHIPHRRWIPSAELRRSFVDDYGSLGETTFLKHLRRLIAAGLIVREKGHYRRVDRRAA